MMLIWVFLALVPFGHSSNGQTTDSSACTGKAANNCVCDSHNIVEFFSEAIIVSRSVLMRAPEAIQTRIGNFWCTDSVPLPPYLLLQTPDTAETLQMKYYRRKHRQKRSSLSMGGRALTENDVVMKMPYIREKRQTSLGIPTDEQLAKVIADIPRETSHHYVPLGSPATLKCFSTQYGIEEDIFGSARKFEWKHANGVPITAPLVLADKFTGDLTFHAVRLADTGVYNCTATFDEENETSDVKTFQSQLDVVSTPMLWLRFGSTFETEKCRHKELLLIQEHIHVWVQQYICHFCPVRNVSVTCQPEQEARNKRLVQISFALSTVGLENLIPLWNHYSDYCPIACVESMHSKVLNVLLSSSKKLFTLKVLVQPSEGKTSVYTPILRGIDNDIASGCPAGFFLNFKLCFPCAAGQYSPHGKSSCFLCPEGMYQPNLASSACFQCPVDYITTSEGSTSQMDCMGKNIVKTWKFIANTDALGYSIAGAIIGLILVTLLIVCCCPETRIGKCLRCANGDDFKEEGSSRERLLTSEKNTDYSDGVEIVKEKQYKIHRSAPRRNSFEGRESLRKFDGQSMTTAEHNISTITAVPSKEPIINRVKKEAEMKPPSHDRVTWGTQNGFRERKNTTINLLSNRKSNREESNKLKFPELLRQPSSNINIGDISPPSFPKKDKISKYVQGFKQIQQFVSHSRLPNKRHQFCAPVPTPSFPRPPFRSPQGTKVNKQRTRGPGYVSESEDNIEKTSINRDPHMKLANVLSKSISFQNKLAERRSQLENAQRDVATRRRDKARSKSILHNRKIFVQEPSINYKPCKACSSNHFLLPVNERIRAVES